MKFNICDGRNRYKACPKCSATVGMGMTGSRDRGKRGWHVVSCLCGFDGPAVAPTGDLSTDDKAAFDAWNRLERPNVELTGEPHSGASRERSERG